MNEVIINIERCKGCCLCTDTCPKKLLVVCERPNASGCYPIRITVQAECTACGLCASVCPDAAIAVYKEVKKN